MYAAKLSNDQGTTNVMVEKPKSNLAKLRAKRAAMHISQELHGAKWDKHPELDSMVCRLLEHRF